MEAAIETASPEDSLPEPTPALPSPETAPPPPNDEPRRFASRADLAWAASLSGLLAFVLALGAMLGGLILINGGLRYANPAQVSSLRSQVEALELKSSDLEENMQGLRSRLDNLETLGGRVDALEENAQQLRADLQASQAKLDQLDQQVGGLAKDVEALQQRSNLFQSFIDGLRNLLNGLKLP